jgi:hypothetical protein
MMMTPGRLTVDSCRAFAGICLASLRNIPVMSTPALAEWFTYVL